MPEALFLSSSAYNDAAFCLQKYEYRHVLRLIPRPSDVRSAPRRGTWIHRCLQLHDHGLPWHEELDRMAKWATAHDVAGVEELYTQTREIVEDYVAFWSGNENDAFGPYETVFTEKPVQYWPVAGKGIGATIDRLVLDKRKRLWIWERKSTSEIPDSDWRNVDPQTMIQYVSCRMGDNGDLPVVGIIFDYVLTEPGPAVQVYKPIKTGANAGRGGRLYDKVIEANRSVSSRAFEAAVPLIRERWQSQLVAPDEDIIREREEYIHGMRLRLVNEAARFQRYPVLRPDDHALATLKDIAITMGEVQRAHEKGHFRRSYNSLTCHLFCPYGKLCMREYQLGRPSEALRQELFVLEDPDLRSEGRSDTVGYSVPGYGAR